MLNQFQKAAAHVYGGGDFAHVTTIDECRDVGDTLFTFIMLELGDDCDTLDTAIARMDRAVQDVAEVAVALCKLPQE